MEYFIDKRVFVTGRKSILSLDNPFNLTAFVNSQISLMGVSCAQNGLNIQAALDPITGTQRNCTELGGDLLRNTTVNGVGTFDMNFLEIFKYRLTIDEEMYLTIGGSQTTAGVGGVLTLLDASTGLCQWSALPTTLTDNIYTVDGSLDSNRILDGASVYNLSFIELNSFIVETVNSVSFIEGDTFLINDYTSFTISSVSVIDMEASTAVDLLTDGGLTLKGGTQLSIQTPSVGSGSPPSIGDVLTLSSVLGECEWQTPGGLLNVGPGLTESPVGTVKLGGAGIGSNENLQVANSDLWEITENGTVANTNLSLGIGNNSTYGPGIISDISVTGNYATTGIINPAIGFSLEIVADNQGTIGNSISIIPNGIDTLEQLVINWNAANPTNTATITYFLGSGYVPDVIESYALSGGTVVDVIALNAVLGTYPPQPLLYQNIPSLNFERLISFDTSLFMKDEEDTKRSTININSSQGITLDTKDTSVNEDNYIDIRYSSGISFGSNISPSYTYTFPMADGLIGQSFVNDGGNNINWEDQIKVVSTAINYTANHKEVVLVTTGATDKDITLPLAARPNQQITIKKIDPGAGVVHVLGNGVETIDGINDQPLNSQYNAITVVSNGTEWFIISNF
jgi:hypothetical protein